MDVGAFREHVVAPIAAATQGRGGVRLASSYQDALVLHLLALERAELDDFDLRDPVARRNNRLVHAKFVRVDWRSRHRFETCFGRSSGSQLSRQTLQLPRKRKRRREMTEPRFKSEQYEYRVAWSPEDDEFVARVTEFPSLSAFGGTPEEALHEIRFVVDAVLKDMADEGEAPPQPLSARQYSGKFALRMPPALHQQLAAEANRMGKSINALIIELLQDRAAQH